MRRNTIPKTYEGRQAAISQKASELKRQGHIVYDGHLIHRPTGSEMWHVKRITPAQNLAPVSFWNTVRDCKDWIDGLPS